MIINYPELSISEIMLKVQKATMIDFPIEIKIGRGTYKIKNPVEANYFSLGIMAKIEADDEKDRL
jgi:hypothetical protein